MNKEKEITPYKSKILRLLKGRVKDFLLIGILALVLFYTAWKIFEEDTSNTAGNFTLSESESKVMRLLQEIDGVGEANVVVREEDGEVKGVVVVCEGANNLRVVLNVREAVAAALNTEQKAVKIYLKKE